MSETITEQLRQEIVTALDNFDNDQIARILDAINIAQHADLLDSIPHHQRQLIWPHVLHQNIGPVLLEANDEVRDNKLEEFSSRQIAEIIETLPDVDDQADIILSLPAEKLVSVLHIIDGQKKARLEAVLSYSEDTAGGLMNLDQITIRADVTLDVVLRYLRIRGEMPTHTDQLFVTDRYDKYQGALFLHDLLTNDTDSQVQQIMHIEVEAFDAQMPDSEVARKFEDNDLISAPIIDNVGRLIGRITVDDVVDVIREEGDQTVMNMAGLAEDEDLFSPVLVSSRRRAIWLGVNLLTAFLAAAVIGFFEKTLDQVVALAILLTIVPSMGGIAGLQTLTLVIRGLALGQLGSSNFRSLLIKELSVSLINGFIWALAVALFSLVWFRDYRISIVIGLALMVNLLVGALSGVYIPILMKKAGIDPALAGGVALTTLTDVIGVSAFLGLATLVLL